MGHDCGKHGYKHKKLICRIFIGFLIFQIAVLFIVFLVWAILRPTKPSFTIQDATVYAFNVSTSPCLLTSTIQLTITSRNPNSKIGVYYDNLHVYATYRDQQITLPTRLPSEYQGHKEISVWSPFVFGNLVPVAPHNAMALAQDQISQMVDLVIKLDCRVRFKVGSFISGRYHLDVRCPARITFGSRSTGVLVGGGVKYQLVQGCSVSL
uniref:Late embryogenesis abundant protein LEA-2 subgroup domain-containing protein n=1 Tax=Kalanchoe fedtschenkoi TaxID=63787 RepID=A0A7N0UTX1_KALFE